MAYTAINKAADFFNTALYSGNEGSNAITGVGFQPDMTWLKCTDAAGVNYIHQLADSVRGETKYISSDSTAAETTVSNNIESWDSDGFTINGDNEETNQNGRTYVGWNWKAGTTTGIAGSPSITPSSYSFNATSGYSIIAYTGNSSSGATLPHGLGVAPKMIIVKNLTTTESWQVYHSALGATKYLKLDANSIAASNTGRWNDTAPTSTLFSLGDSAATNENPYNYIAYCFADVKGYSQFGSYTGNGVATYSSTDVAPFIYTGFKPAFFMLKSSTAVENWYTMDNKRDGYNPDNPFLNPDENTAEIVKTNNLMSNGVKLGTPDGSTNGSGQIFIYAAFGQSLVGSNGVVGTAR
jgi:hypothetical protein